jgi:hypothetical protein
MKPLSRRDFVVVIAGTGGGLPYVGVLGPRRLTLQIIEDLGASDADAARIFAPAGLDIGAETADEIALAIVAEVQAVMAGRSGGSCGSGPEPSTEGLQPGLWRWQRILLPPGGNDGTRRRGCARRRGFLPDGAPETTAAL